MKVRFFLERIMFKAVFALLFSTLLFCGCEKKKSESHHRVEKVLRISSNEDPQTLDPRLVRSLPNMTFIKMFYEGLMVQGKEGEILPGVAKEVELSKNGKVYTFHLRDCTWSNGDLVTASHFAAAWKSLLAPDFPAPMAYQFFLIKGAKDAKQGALPLDQVGIAAKDDKTLVVELNEPAPYFLEMTTMGAFSPVHPASSNIFNGPFLLDKWVKSNEVQAVKNPRYWDAEHVKLDRIIAMVLEENTALKMFQQGELDWAGSPLSSIPVDAKSALKRENKLLNHPAAGTHYFSFNTSKPPFDNVNLRKALSLSINREDIVTHITQGDQMPATGFVPLSYGLQTFPYFEDHNVEGAKALFAKALEEIGELPEIKLSFSSNDINNKIAQAVQQQWKEVLGLEVALDQCELKFYSDRLKGGDFLIGLKSWYGDFRDPINFLEIFKNKSNGTNNTAWENQQFSELLNLSTRVSDRQNRMNILRRAEKILVNDMPVAPLYYNSYNYVKREQVKEVYFSDLGILDFKYADVE
jgi:oligopeptide transport system substrate-binding protein